MKPHELLGQVQDRDSFIAFVRALAAEREAAQEVELAHPDPLMVDGTFDWMNTEIAPFLYACLDYFEDKPFHKPEDQPSWKMFAEFLYFGKIIE